MGNFIIERTDRSNWLTFMKIHLRYFHSQLNCFWRLSNFIYGLPFWPISKYQLIGKLFRKDDSTLLVQWIKRNGTRKQFERDSYNTSWSVLFPPPQTSSIVYKNEPKWSKKQDTFRFPIWRTKSQLRILLEGPNWPKEEEKKTGVPIYVVRSVKWHFEACFLHYNLTSKSFANR